jgi:hypothetical protein
MKMAWRIAMLCAVVSQPAMAESIFDLDKIPSGRLQVQQKLFQETLEGWMNNTVKDERLKLSSDLNVFFTGEDFVRLVNMGAAGVPHMVNRLYQAGFDDFFSRLRPFAYAAGIMGGHCGGGVRGMASKFQGG